MTTNEKKMCEKKTRGRPKQFDRDRALDQVLRLFWRDGYESTSLADLVAVTGAKAPTLYAEFGNKEGLFLAAVECYLEKYTACTNRILERDEPVAAIIEAYIHAYVKVFTDLDTPSGCFMVCTSSALSSSAGAIAAMLQKKHQEQEASLKACFDRKVQQGEVALHTDTMLLAKFIICNIEGMSVQAREGANHEDLLQLLAALMAVWPHLCQAEALRKT